MGHLARNPDRGNAKGRRSKKIITAEDLAFWSFQPLAKVSLPDVKDRAWVSQPVDRFILARLEANGLHPVQAADKQTLDPARFWILPDSRPIRKNCRRSSTTHPPMPTPS
jgi:hypothetical protein